MWDQQTFPRCRREQNPFTWRTPAAELLHGVSGAFEPDGSSPKALQCMWKHTLWISQEPRLPAGNIRRNLLSQWVFCTHVGKLPFDLWTWFYGARSAETQTPGERSTEKQQGPHSGKKGIHLHAKITLKGVFMAAANLQKQLEIQESP